jgi:hypothetical protein
MFPPPGHGAEKEKEMLWAVLAVLVILWLMGYSYHIAGGLIHILLIAAVIVLVINLWRGRDSGL